MYAVLIFDLLKCRKKRDGMNLPKILQLINDMEKGMSATEIQSKYGLINRSNITEIMKRKKICRKKRSDLDQKYKKVQFSTTERSLA